MRVSRALARVPADMVLQAFDGGGSSAFLQLQHDSFQNRIGVGERVAVPESQDGGPLRPQPLVALGVVVRLGLVLTAVDFDY